MRRLTLSLLLVVVSAILGLGWGIDQWYNNRYVAQESAEIGHYRQLGKQLVSLINITGASESLLSSWAEQSHTSVQLTGYDDFPLPRNLKVSFEQGEPLLLDSENNISLHYFLPEQRAVLSLTFSVINKNTSQLSVFLTLLFYFGVIFIVLLWLFPLLKRLTLLRRSAQAFGVGDLSVRIPRSTVSYIADIEQDFNRMAQQIENLISDNKLLSRGLSHDLRTPLARLRFGLDVLEEANLSEQQEKTLAHLNRDLEAMESLVEALLSYARLEQGKIDLQLKPLDLMALVMKLNSEFYLDEIVLRLDSFKPTLMILADAQYISMLIHNLIQNALNHSRGRVVVSLTAQNDRIGLIVEDNGVGIPVEEREHVLKPFYRANTSAHTQGHGIGLAIVDRVVQWHKAELVLGASESLGGLKIAVYFSECY